jgi:hypothetical protein
MEEKIKGNGIYLITVFCILVSAIFLKEMVFLIKDSLSFFGHAIYGICWVLIILLIAYKYLKKVNGISPWSSFAIAAVFGLILSLLSYIINGILGTDKLIEKNYVAIYGQTEEYDSSSDSEFIVDHKTFVFRKDNMNAKRELRNLENKYGESTSDDYVFWQTAFVEGFEPKYISDYNGTKLFSKKLTLFFTVGPLFILESLINSIMSSWILMIIPIVAMLFKIKLFEKDLKPYLDLFNKEAKKTTDNRV